MNNSPRPAIRFPAQVETVEVVTRSTARVVDESKTGIALAFDGPLLLAIGQTVEIDYNGVAMKAIVRRIEECADGVRVAGFQWQ